MAKTIEDMTGKSFGRLLVKRLHEERVKGGGTIWVCQCDCGNLVNVRRSNLVSGQTQSCGCRKNELSAQRLREQKTSHGMTGTPEYNTWAGMIQRCHNPNHDAFERYGANGITVCDRWRSSFDNFYADMGPRPSSDHTLDRENNNLGYSPGNCRWVVWEVQQNNRTDNRKYLFNGMELTLAEISRQAGVSYFSLYNRVARNDVSVDDALLELTKLQ